MDSQHHCQQDDLFDKLLDCLEDQIAVIDEIGTIIYVNNAWRQFGSENGQPPEFDWIGTNYLKVCEVPDQEKDPEALAAYDGIRQVLSGGQSNFYIEYPCHSSTERRWFLMRIVPLRGLPERYFVISHVNITQRRLVEEQVAAQSLCDALTGIANRRHFDRFLHDEWQRSMRAGTPISLILFDLDFFKQYNDTLGHRAGDEFLRMVGAVLKEHARRPSDLAARYGGEEFALILGNTDQHAAESAAEAVRLDIARLQDVLKCGNCCVSASAGVVCTVPQQGCPEGSLVEQADSALYAAKHAGRNRVFSQVFSLA